MATLLQTLGSYVPDLIVRRAGEEAAAKLKRVHADIEKTAADALVVSDPQSVSWLFNSHSHPGALVWIFITYIAFFALSQGAVIWVYIGEVFPNHVRSKGQGVGNASHWIMNTIIALEFPVLVVSLGRSAPFTFFAIMTTIQFLTVLFTYPETKGQTLEALQRKLVAAD